MNRGRPRHDDILTPREWEVLALIEAGLTNEEIAECLGVSFGTAKYHVAEIISKLGATSREDAVAAARRGAAPALAFLPFRFASRPVHLIAAGSLAGVAAVLVLLAVLVWSGSTTPGPAPDLSNAAADFVQRGLADSPQDLRPRDAVRSMAMTMTSSSYLVSGERAGDVARQITFKLWYRAPQLMRIETGKNVSVWDGKAFWRYDPARNLASVAPQDPDRDIFTHGHAYMVQWIDDLDAYIEDAARCRTAALTGEGIVAGRGAHVLELGRNRCGIAYPGSDGRLVLWIDKETGLILKRDQYSLAGRPAYVSEVTDFEVNLPLQEERFSFTPPAAAEFEDDRDQPLGVLYASDMPEPDYLTLAGVREAATFPVRLPAFVPDKFELESVEHHWASEFARQNHSHADWVLLRYADAEGNWLQISQGFPGSYVAIVADPPERYSGTVTVNGVEATWIEGWPLSDEVWQPGVRMALYWDAGRLGNGWERSPDGEVTTGSPLSIGLSSNVLSLDKLVAVAESLE